MKVIATEKAPAAIGPYSQAIEVEGTIYVSGQLPIDAATGEFASDEIKGQTKQSLEKNAAILLESVITKENVIKTTVLLQYTNDLSAMNEVYAGYFSAPFPARAAFEVAKLPKGAKVEIEAVAKR